VPDQRSLGYREEIFLTTFLSWLSGEHQEQHAKNKEYDSQGWLKEQVPSGFDRLFGFGLDKFGIGRTV
jgi:hypothetical protein